MTYKSSNGDESGMSATGCLSRVDERTEIDVTDIPTDEVEAYVRTEHDRDVDLYLERRGGRTYLVAR